MSNPQDTLKSKEQKSYIKLERKDRMIVFWLLTFMNILFNMDHGTIPAATQEIQNDMNIQETVLGSFGSLVYLGSLIGSFILTKLIDHVDRKALTIFTLVLNAVLIFLFTQATSIPFLFSNRILVGVMQSFNTVYFPVWIDQYGPKQYKTIMMSAFNITSPLGVILGYVMTMIIKVYFNVSISKSL